MFIDLLILWLVNVFFPEEKPKGRRKQGEYTTTGLLVAGTLFHDDHRDDGKPKSFYDTDNNDPFLNEEYNDGPDW